MPAFWGAHGAVPRRTRQLAGDCNDSTRLRPRHTLDEVQDEEKSPDTPLVLDLRSSGPTFSDLDIHVHTVHGWTVGQDLCGTFSAAGMEVQLGGFADSVTHTVVTVLSAAGGAAGAAAALNAFFQRHRHRKITVKVDDQEVSIEGFSPEDTERLLKSVFEDIRPTTGGQ